MPIARINQHPHFVAANPYYIAASTCVSQPQHCLVPATLKNTVVKSLTCAENVKVCKNVPNRNILTSPFTQKSRGLTAKPLTLNFMQFVHFKINCTNVHKSQAG